MTKRRAMSAMEAADAMAEGRDVNAERRARKAAEAVMKPKPLPPPAPAPKSRNWVADLFARSPTVHHTKKP